MKIKLVYMHTPNSNIISSGIIWWLKMLQIENHSFDKYQLSLNIDKDILLTKMQWKTSVDINMQMDFSSFNAFHCAKNRLMKMRLEKSVFMISWKADFFLSAIQKNVLEEGEKKVRVKKKLHGKLWNRAYESRALISCNFELCWNTQKRTQHAQRTHPMCLFSHFKSIRLNHHWHKWNPHLVYVLHTTPYQTNASSAIQTWYLRILYHKQK